jgi:ASC-1-like (ASCH) protein
MDHVAIMKASWKLTEKVLSGEKTIESRWYTSRRTPWDSVVVGERIYFKDSGSPVTACATVAKVLQFELTSEKVKEILDTYGAQIGIPPASVPKFYERFKDKKYCVLVFLEDARAVEPFDIDKKGFGNMAAWITVEDVNTLRR